MLLNVFFYLALFGCPNLLTLPNDGCSNICKIKKAELSDRVSIFH
jgi:hypothetical protein